MSPTVAGALVARDKATVSLDEGEWSTIEVSGLELVLTALTRSEVEQCEIVESSLDLRHP